MPAYSLSLFSNPGILRQLAPEHLISLLAPHAAFFSARSVILPEPPADGGFDYDGLARVFMTADEHMPKELREALFFIQELASPEGMACLLEAAEQEGIEITGRPAPSPADVAVQLWLKDHELLERKHAEQFLANARRFESFSTAVSPVPEYAKPTPELMAQMKMSLDEFYEKRKRGRNAKVFPYERNDGVWFLVRHGDPFKREGAINDDGESVGVYYWPEKFDVVVLDPTEGDLRINTRTQGEIKQYRKVFGRHLYGDDGFFSGASKYTLTPLREKGEDALAPVDGIEQIVLTEVHFFRGGSFNEREIRKADDVFGAYKARDQQFPARARIIKACFRVKFADSATPRMVTIKPPNVALYTRDADSVLIEAWLRARGFLIGRDTERNEPTVEMRVAGT